MVKGKVYLVGAGPGDIGLITVKGLRILERAEVVVYDFHLNPQILNYIKRSAEFIYAGKRGGHHTMTQEEINHVLIEKARQGRMVCRLKGGDPFVFGRGGEEAETLAREGIAFEVVPGVSSVIAAPAYAGIPLTHRDYSSSFSVITGSEAVAEGEESRVDWQAISKGDETLVFLMGVKNIEVIVQRLVDHGKSPVTPTAVIRWGTRPDQKTVVGTLGNIAELVRNEQIRPPAVMVDRQRGSTARSTSMVREEAPFRAQDTDNPGVHRRLRSPWKSWVARSSSSRPHERWSPRITRNSTGP